MNFTATDPYTFPGERETRETRESLAATLAVEQWPPFLFFTYHGDINQPKSKKLTLW